MHLLFFLYYIHMRLNEVSNIHIYKINGNKILKIWDLKLICKTSVHLHLFQVTVVPWKLKYVVTLRKKCVLNHIDKKNLSILSILSFYFQIQVHGCTGQLSFSKMGVRNETYLQLKSLGTSRNGTVRILTHYHYDKYVYINYIKLWCSAWKIIFESAHLYYFKAC